MLEEKVDNTELFLHTANESVPSLLLETIELDELYEVKIHNIYDLSKFWLVLRFKELNIFMQYLTDFYSKPENVKTMTRTKLEKGLVCIVSRNQMFYRSIVQPILLPDKKKVRVFMIDYGLIVNVHIDNILCIAKKHLKIPRFAIRACLADISPTDPSKTWSQTDLKTFCALVEERQLIVKICEIDFKRNILFVDIRTISGSVGKSVNDSLVGMNIATYNTSDKRYELPQIEKMKKYKAKVKYLHLFPTFEALESGVVPCSLWESALLKTAVPLDLLYKNYFLYQDSNDSNGFANGMN